MGSSNFWIVRTAEMSYRVHNMNKKECIAYLIECGMDEATAKEKVKRFVR